VSRFLFYEGEWKRRGTNRKLVPDDVRTDAIVLDRHELSRRLADAPREAGSVREPGFRSRLSVQLRPIVRDYFPPRSALERLPDQTVKKQADTLSRTKPSRQADTLIAVKHQITLERAKRIRQRAGDSVPPHAVSTPLGVAVSMARTR
jgi:hypothetical protein